MKIQDLTKPNDNDEVHQLIFSYIDNYVWRNNEEFYELGEDHYSYFLQSEDYDKLVEQIKSKHPNIRSHKIRAMVKKRWDITVRNHFHTN